MSITSMKESLLYTSRQKTMLQNPPFLICTLIINVLLLIFVSPVLFCLGITAAIFGLPAYGNLYSHICIFIFVLAALTFPIGLLLGTISGCMLLAGKFPRIATVGLTLPLPHLLVFGIITGWLSFSARGDIARTINPQSASDFERLANKNILTRNYKDAQKRFDQAIAVAPQIDAAKLAAIAGRAFVKSNQGDVDGAINDYRLYMKLAKKLPPNEQPQPPQLALLAIGYVNCKAGRYGEALKICDEAAAASRCYGDLQQMLLIRSRIHKAMGDDGAAKEDMQLRANWSAYSEIYPGVPRLLPVAERDTRKLVSQLQLNTMGYMSPSWTPDKKEM
jgi:hypothetical protein